MPLPVVTAPKCPTCGKSVYSAEEVRGPGGNSWHALCFCCKACGKSMRGGEWREHAGEPHCAPCHGKLFGIQGVGFGASLANAGPARASVASVVKDETADDDSEEAAKPKTLKERLSMFKAATGAADAENENSDVVVAKPKRSSFTGPNAPKCPACGKSVYAAEEVKGPNGKSWHQMCFCCQGCGKSMRGGQWRDHDGQPHCFVCHNKLFGIQGVGFGGTLCDTGKQSVPSFAAATETPAAELPASAPSEGCAVDGGSLKQRMSAYQGVAGAAAQEAPDRGGQKNKFGTVAPKTDMKPEDAAQEAGKREVATRESAAQETAAPQAAAQEAAAREAAARDTAKREAAEKEAAKRAAAEEQASKKASEAAAREVAERKTVEQEAAKQAAAEDEASKKAAEAAAHEAAERKAAEQEAAKQAAAEEEASKKAAEAAAREAAEREVAEQEAAKRAAAEEEASRKAAQAAAREAAERKAAEQEEAKRAAAEEEASKKAAEAAAREAAERKAAEQEAAKKAAAEEEASKKAAEAAAREAAEREAAEREAASKEAAKRAAAEEKASKQAAEEAALQAEAEAAMAAAEAEAAQAAAEALAVSNVAANDVAREDMDSGKLQVETCGPCENYRLDMAGKSFGDCKCGFPKSAHQQGAPSKAPDGSKQSTAKEGAPEKTPGKSKQTTVEEGAPEKTAGKSKQTTVEEETSIATEPCGNYRLNMAGKTFGDCKCGFPKTAHSQGTPAKPPNEPEKISAPEGTLAQPPDEPQKTSAPEETSIATEPCGNYRLDMAGKTFGDCKCGFPKTAHNQGTPAQPPNEPEKISAPEGTPAQPPDEPEKMSAPEEICIVAEPCGNYRLDMAGKTFGDCKCGFPKSAHNQGTPAKTADEPEQISAPEEEKADTPCPNYRLDLAGKHFGDCKCGFPKSAH